MAKIQITKNYRIEFHQDSLNSGIWCQNLRHTTYVNNSEVALPSHRPNTVFYYSVLK